MAQTKRRRDNLHKKETMSGLPQDLISDILLCLPVKTLLRFRCLSKYLCTEIDSPAFSKAHLKRSLQAKSHRKVVFGGSKFTVPNTDIYAIDFDDRLIRPIKISNPLKSKYSGTKICGSCNGLVLLCNGEEISLWNPFTRRYKKLPTCLGKPACFNVLSLGYDYIGDEYKVIQIDPSLPFFKVWVFNLASNSWRSIEPTYIHSPYRPGVFANGAFHWVENFDRFRDKWYEIASFDLSKEEFVEVFPRVRPHKEDCILSLEVLGRDVILCSNSKDQLFAWKKLGESDFHEISSFKYLGFVKLLEYSKDGSRILLHSNHRDQLLWYDLKEKTMEPIEILDVPCVYKELCFCWESLVSLGADSEFDGGNTEVTPAASTSQTIQKFLGKFCFSWCR